MNTCPNPLDFFFLINNNPEKYYTPEILEQLDAVCAKEFKYGDHIEEVEENTEDTADT